MADTLAAPMDRPPAAPHRDVALPAADGVALADATTPGLLTIFAR
jgi:hypothetical protein